MQDILDWVQSNDKVEELLYDKRLLNQIPRHPKGHAQIRNILRATVEFLQKEGYRSITFGSLSRELGIAKGNIQYYFPTRDSLLRSAMMLQIETMKSGWLSASKKSASDSREKLIHLIEWDISFSRNESFKAIAQEKRAYATRDDQSRRMVHEWYDWVNEQYAEILKELRPDLDHRQLYKLSALVNSMLEGLAPYFGVKRLKNNKLHRLDIAVQDAVFALIYHYGMGSQFDSVKATNR